jgi:hypothetical protein
VIVAQSLLELLFHIRAPHWRFRGDARRLLMVPLTGSSGLAHIRALMENACRDHHVAKTASQGETSLWSGFRSQRRSRSSFSKRRRALSLALSSQSKRARR